jgi:VWFA-related protein
MKYRSLFVLFLFAAAACPVIYGQSHRTSPVIEAGKVNKRPPAPAATPIPSPTAEPAADATQENASADPAGSPVIDSGDIVKVDTKLVTIPVRVVDRNSRFIGGLSKADFRIFEDNVEQDVEYFTNEEQPFTVALVLDMSYSTKFKIADIQAAAREIIDQLRSQDSVMVVSFDEEVHILCEPTNDRDRIYRAIKSTKVATGTSLYEAVATVMNRTLRQVKGRKAIILFTDGVDTTSRRVTDRDNLDDAMEIDSLVYPIRYDTYADVQAMKNKPIVDPTQPQLPGTRSPFPFPLPSIGTADGKGTREQDYLNAQEYLDQLALRTGGQLYVANDTTNLAGAFSKIASELREFYSLGYYPKENAKSRKVRMLKVKVAQKGLVVRARDKYVVSEEERKNSR